MEPGCPIEGPPIKAGTARFDRNAQVATHEVESLDDTLSEYLRIELNSEPTPPYCDARLRTARGRPLGRRTKGDY